MPTPYMSQFTATPVVTYNSYQASIILPSVLSTLTFLFLHVMSCSSRLFYFQQAIAHTDPFQFPLPQFNLSRGRSAQKVDIPIVL